MDFIKNSLEKLDIDLDGDDKKKKYKKEEEEKKKKDKKSKKYDDDDDEDDYDKKKDKKDKKDKKKKDKHDDDDDDYDEDDDYDKKKDKKDKKDKKKKDKHHDDYDEDDEDEDDDKKDKKKDKKKKDKDHKYKMNDGHRSKFNEDVHQEIKKQNKWNRDVDDFYRQKGGSKIRASECNGNKKALFVGINYFNSQAELKGCINDVQNISRLVCNKYGFRDCLYLTDDQNDSSRQPTYRNIINGFRWLVQGARPGDSLFFHYSGHGGTSVDKQQDEVDGFDETILPVDYSRSGQITDDVIYDELVKPLPDGCRLTAIFDSCHSGTVMDLPYTYQCDGSVEVIENDQRKEIFKKVISAAAKYMQGDSQGMFNELKEGLSTLINSNENSNNGQVSQEDVIKLREHSADVIQFSGCRDNQTSADANINNRPTGAMSYAIITLLQQNRDYSYSDLLTNIRKIMIEKNFSQIPQLSTSRPMDMNSRFFM